MNALGALDRFVRAPPPASAAVVPAAAAERCQFCARVIAEAHAHVVDLEQRCFLCACDGCARPLAHPAPGTAADRYRLVPSRVLMDPGHPLSDVAWATLQIPVRLAFLFFNSRLARWVSFYPSPAGAAEAELPEGAVQALATSLPLCAELRPDVEALLVHGRMGRPLEAFIAPIDACYRLVGRVRLHWRGFHGGDVAWREIEAMFEDLRARAQPLAVPVAAVVEKGVGS